eukprot:3643483-Alexandrium_andersonii.AAC.1
MAARAASMLRTTPRSACASSFSTALISRCRCCKASWMSAKSSQSPQRPPSASTSWGHDAQ